MQNYIAACFDRRIAIERCGYDRFLAKKWLTDA
jgi:hypothetical protein